MSSYESLKVPPHSIEAEQSVLGGLLLAGRAQDGSAFETVATLLQESDFYRQDHRLIFRAFITMASDNQPLDVVTVSEWLKQRNELENAGGFAYLATVVRDTPSAANIKAYAKIVRNQSLRRQLIAVGAELIEQSYKANAEDDSVAALIESAATAIFALEQAKGKTEEAGLRTIKAALKTKLVRIEAAQKQAVENKGQLILNGVPTGFEPLDRRWTGLEKGRLYTLAARPAMGKSAVALQIAQNVAHHVREQNQFVAIFSLEMDEDELLERLIATAGVANYGHLRAPWELTDDDWPRIATGVKRLAGTNIFIDDASQLRPAQMMQRIRHVMFETGMTPALVMVDHIHLMEGDKKYSSENRVGEVSEISRKMKVLAKNYKVPVLQLAQLNRGVEGRTNKRPVMADLRESGSIEQDSNNIVFLYRESVYDKDCGHNNIELISEKVRGGQIGTDILTWDGVHQRVYDPFANAVPAEYAVYAEQTTGGTSRKGW